MKKLTVVLTLISVCAVSMLGTGCSSAKPAKDEAPAPAAEISKPAPAPADLGASNAGRGR